MSEENYNIADKGASENFLREDGTPQQDQTTEDSKPDVSTTAARYFLTATLGAGFLGLGASLTILGLALPTLAANLGSSIDDLSLVLIARGGGYVTGSFIAGTLESKVNFLFLAAVSLLSMALGMILTPLILNVASFYICTAISSLGMGGFETVANVLCLYLWGKKSGPVLQFLHFWFCFGCAITPYFARPFLNEVFYYSTIPSNSSAAENITSFQNVTYIENTDLPFVSVPYFVIAGILTTVTIFLIILKLFFSWNLTGSQDKNTTEFEGTRYRYGVLFLLFWFFFVFIGMEVVFSTFLYKFGISESPGLAYSRDVSADLSVVFFFSVVIGQFLAIFWSQKFSPEKILAADLLGVGIAAILVLFYPLYFETAPILFWITVGLVGFSSTSIYACVLSWASHRITFDGRAMSVSVFGGSLGEMVLPIPVGFLIEKHVLSFLYFISGYAFVLILLFLMMVKFAQTKSEKHSLDNPAELDNLQIQGNSKMQNQKNG
ncbi:sodium-dependent glucose transporter 1A-like isoform X2 [Clavelina lepadiformis]